MDAWVKNALAPSQTALIVVDVQHDFCAPDGSFARNGMDIGAGRRILLPLRRLIDGARKAGAAVVYLRFIEDDSGHVVSEAYDRQRYRAGNSLRYCNDTTGQAIVPEVAPLPGEAIVNKVRASGFFNTSLDTILRCRNVRTLVLTGMATDSCVLATAIDATARDYYVILASDCLSSFSAERHDAALKILSYKHPVAGSKELLDVWRDAAVNK